jgi:hypothetical protein
MTLLVFLLLILLPTPSPCQLKVTPLVAIAPLTYLRLTTQIDFVEPPWQSAEVCLYESGMRIRCSTLFDGDNAGIRTRTQQTEWKTLRLPAADYEARLVVSGPKNSCTDRQTILVQ